MDFENNCNSSEEVHVLPSNSNNTTPHTHEDDDEEEEAVEEERVRAWDTLEEKVTKLKLKLAAAREVIRHQQEQISELQAQLESKKTSQMCPSNSNLGLQDSSLAEFFTNIGLSHYLPVFVKEDFDMESLQLLDETELKDMEIPRGPRLKIIQQIKKLKASPVAAPSSPAPLHIPSTVVTLATESDERPLPLVVEHNGVVDREDSGVEPEEGKDGEETEGEDTREEGRDEDEEEGGYLEKQQEEERTWLNPTAKQRRKSGEVSAEDFTSAVQQESKEREREKRNNKRLSNEVWKKKQVPIQQLSSHSLCVLLSTHLISLKGEMAWGPVQL